jgi:hypothetical protein
MISRKYPFVNKKILLIPLLFLSVSISTFGQNRIARELSQDAYISVLTCSAGEELYSVFGHTAIRVSDPENEVDLVFNYGTFDFNTPFFYLKFGHGNLDYLLSVSTFKRFMREYFMEGRSVWEQELNLTQSQTERLVDALMINAKPENRAYAYDFFYDNCATRVADIILEQFDKESIHFETNDPRSERITFREAIHPYLSSKPWTKLGIDLVLGAPADAPTDSRSIMFLPDHLMSQVSGIRAMAGGDSQNIVAHTNNLLDFSDKQQKSTAWFSPLTSFWLLLIAVVLLSAAEAYGTIRLKYLDIVLWGITGLLGIVIFYLSWISNHQVTSPNWNLLWANPLWLLLITNITRRVRKIIFFLETFAILVFFFIMFLGVQIIPNEVYPLILVLLIRSIRPFNWWINRQNPSPTGK